MGSGLRFRRLLSLLYFATPLLSAMPAHAEIEYAPPAAANARYLLWGDTHLHTSLSADANVIGNIALTPADAFRFARGETIRASSGHEARLARPLDFLVVSDHAEYLGILPKLRAAPAGGGPGGPGANWMARFRSSDVEEKHSASLQLVRSFSSGEEMFVDEDVRHSAWRTLTGAAEAANDPGRFTALAGFEWTSMPAGNNLHRIVLFRDGEQRTGQITPLSAFQTEDPEKLWDFLEAYERDTGGRVLAIPHNSNLSNGLMFAEARFDGSAMDRRYVERRQRWEPVVEVTQIKGDSESHPALSPDDEFAGFGTWDQGNLDSTALKKPEMLRFEYARSALGLGLGLRARFGLNPFQFGMIGSTDSHTALSTTDEDNFWGKAAPWEPGVQDRIGKPFLDYKSGPDNRVMSWQQLAAGYAAVWATDNTREAIFDAVARREVYATTGTRIAVRFFGGWSFVYDDAFRPDMAGVGYASGVPMGGVLPKAPKEAAAPVFLLAAMRDAEGANLDRIQIVKGWIDAKGNTRERVYDLAWSDGRKPGRDGKLPPAGNTVDVEHASWLNTIGSGELRAAWRDPDFDPRQDAFYYGRVLQIPTPRWVLYDHLRLGADLPADAQLTHQERAYTSPIWYEAP